MRDPDLDGNRELLVTCIRGAVLLLLLAGCVWAGLELVCLWMGP